MLRRARPLLLALIAAACFDPLYEDGAPLTSGWVVCCVSGRVDTCFCDDAATCQRPTYACEERGRCASTPICSSGTGGGAASGGGGGLQDAGLPGGGAGGGAGFQDAGASGGGAGGGGGSSTDAGAGTGGGGGTPTSFEFCCVGARVTTCVCPVSGCLQAAFTPCPGGACGAGTASAACR